MMTRTSLPGMAVTMPNAIQFEVHVGWPVKFAELERAIADSDIAGVNSIVLRGRESGARLVAYAKGVKADLVVAGTRSPATIAERVSGGVGGRVLRTAERLRSTRGTEHRTRVQATNFKETDHALIARTKQDGIAAAAVDPH